MKKVAVIGFGFMGFAHAQNILKFKQLKLAAIIDKDVNAVVSKVDDPDGNFSTGDTDVEAIKAVPVYTTLAECLKDIELDAVHVCVHTNLHYAITKEALECGLHVMLEKPFVLDIDEGKQLIQLAAKKERVLMIAHVVRFMSPYKRLTEIIKSGDYGKLKFLSLNRFSGLPVWGEWKEKQKDFGSSGGALFDLVIHDIDFAAFLLGQPEEIQSTVLPGRLSRHDYLEATWRYPNKDICVKIEGGNIFHTSYPFQAGYTAVLEEASIHFSTNDGDHIYIDNDKERNVIPASELGDGYYNEIQFFAESIEKGFLPEEYNPESALTTIELCYRHL